ncbi:hypothetical protein ACS0TY_033992 [Phlomoides rotata]
MIQMEEVEKRRVLKKLERCLSMKSQRRNRKKGEVAPTGCFPVYVGPEKQRFVIRAEFANHPLFKMLLEEAEMEYGFRSEGPLLLPCDVQLFCNVLAEMMDSDDRAVDDCGSCNPARRLGKHSTMAKGCTSYGLLTPPINSLRRVTK